MNRHARTKAESVLRTSPKESVVIASSSSLWLSFCSSFLPNLLVIVVAVAAVYFELTTSDSYVHSTALLSLLKRSFIFWSCLAARIQLTDFVTPPEVSRRPPSIRKEASRHVRALFGAIAANLLGSTIIRPVFGATPQFEDTIRLVVPIYFLVEIVVAGLRFPMPLLKTIIGLSVSWLKAIMIPKLAMEWQSSTNAHPLGFLAISTANLYASGLVLRYLTNYTQTHRVLDLSTSSIGGILQIIGTSGVIGIVAYVANHFKSHEERVLEARVLYFCVAWFALHKYWKKAVRELLVSMFVSPTKSKTV
ncbi:unnamed protein product [Peronospora destructor]|uniref:Uncharacterized protein n=1 Tax=Peronospora destructor TaxID=86335 RepID=A0AAV0V825_9STRA|nr:unnamed protein product [Peronospora destructor]